ncbi:hypothetical protein SAMN04488074_11618 [Lentzea albidocapillata subsp. violacea]|uniref:Uncharacterized protein n=1 Tax=Lentzea albidocapillata subsp. violacea TaxID=128104 RepID=A0A1G9Q3P1_9PSEU|nr:hypothetical protein [Lentzea albidocapillata]SDM05662.1 hypothetical protein SAMN04488074_11618 [Lentzea albidocapillata subsp. violacea]
MRPSPKTDVLVAVDTALRPTGFVRRGHVWLQERGDGVSGWLGFGVAGALDLTPLVGVCFRRYDAVCRTLGVGIPTTPVVSMPLGHLMPDKPVWKWTFEPGGDHAPVAASLVAAFLKHGKPYIDKYAKWDTLARELVAKPESLLDFERARKLAVIHVLGGNPGAAREALKKETERLEDSRDVYARSHRALVHRFEPMFG